MVFLDALRQEKVLNWTFLSPSALFEPGERTGKFRLGDDVLLADDEGKSWISMEDYAIALADEIETPRHTRRRYRRILILSVRAACRNGPPNGGPLS